MTTRYAIYSRYSSDVQSDRSIEDQIVTCKSILQGDDKIVNYYEDRAMSGTLMNKRLGLLSLLADAESQIFDIVLSESLDRLSRDMENISHIYKILTFYGIKIKTLHEGEINPFHIGISGAMSTMHMKQLKERIRRGLKGNIRSGKFAGSMPYGYKVKVVNDDGKPERGLREIHEEHADIVRYIFTEYANGELCAVIARTLNQRGIPSPRGKEWTPTTIVGPIKKNYGIILNPMYKGDVVYGRVIYHRHPVTNVKITKLRPPQEWELNRAEYLRIVSDNLWAACHKRSLARHKASHDIQRIKIKSLKLICGRCQRKMRKRHPNYYICSNHERYHSCKQKKGVNIEKLLILIAKSIEESRENTVFTVQEENIKLLSKNIDELSNILDDIISSVDYFSGTEKNNHKDYQEAIQVAVPKLKDLRTRHMEQVTIHIGDLLKEQALKDSYFAAKKKSTEMEFFESIISNVTVHHEDKDMIIDVKWIFSAIQKICFGHLQDRKYSA